MIVKVTKVSGSTVTAQVGKLTEVTGASAQPGGENQQGAPPAKPEGQGENDSAQGQQSDGENGSDTNSGQKPAGDPPEKPDGNPPSGQPGGTPPAKPEDSSGSGEAKAQAKEDGDKTEKQAGGSGQTADGAEGKEMPQGQMPGGTPGAPGGSTFEAGNDTVTFQLTDDTEVIIQQLQGEAEGSIKNIVNGEILEITLDEEDCASKIIVRNLRAGSGFGGSETVSNGTAATVLDSDTTESGKTYQSSGDDENALRVDDAAVTLKNSTIKKTGGASSNTENGDFYGANAGLLATNGANVTISKADVTTDAANGNGIFSCGTGTVVKVSDSKIRTAKNNSGGIQTTGGGTMEASNLDIETQGNSAAAIRSDRGGGTVTVNKGTYVTNGTGSPAIYSTADITVKNAALKANASEGVVVEGKNSVALENCHVIGNMKETYNGDSSENIHGIMIYQSMSGDADVGEASFSAKSGSITAETGDLFYITNTDCRISLENTDLNLANGTLLRIEGNDASRGWGTKGTNGGDVTLTAKNQKLTGKILVDKISSLNMTMSGSSTFKGAVNPDGDAGTVNVTLKGNASWSLSADSYVSQFHGDVENIKTNGHHLYVNGKQVK